MNGDTRPRDRGEREVRDDHKRSAEQRVDHLPHGEGGRDEGDPQHGRRCAAHAAECRQAEGDLVEALQRPSE
jgi:hypothetical protein